jgi:hypothetical protein
MGRAIVNILCATMNAGYISGSIRWLQRDRLLSVASDMHLGRKGDAIARDLEALKEMGPSQQEKVQK